MSIYPEEKAKFLGNRFCSIAVFGLVVFFSFVFQACVSDFPAGLGDENDSGRSSQTPDVSPVSYQMPSTGQKDASIPSGMPTAPPLVNTVDDAGAPKKPNPAPDAQVRAAKPKEPLVVRLQARESPEGDGCDETTWTLDWTAQGAEACRLRADPPAELPNVDFIRDSSGTFEVTVVQSTQVFLECNDGSNNQVMSVRLRMSPNLPPTIRFANADEVVEEQRRCAAALGQNKASSDSRVYYNDRSALQICACAGYTQVGSITEVFTTGVNRCWFTPHDNFVSIFQGDQWNDTGAFNLCGFDRCNRCIDTLTCTNPVQECRNLLYSR